MEAQEACSKLIEEGREHGSTPCLLVYPPKFTSQPDETGAFVTSQRIGVHFMVKVPKEGMTDELKAYLDSIHDRGAGYTLCDESGEPYLTRILDDAVYTRRPSEEVRSMLDSMDETRGMFTFFEETSTEEMPALDENGKVVIDLLH